jgi:hypothetical protein
VARPVMPKASHLGPLGRLLGFGPGRSCASISCIFKDVPMAFCQALLIFSRNWRTWLSPWTLPSLSKASPTSLEQVVARPLIGWLAMYLSMEVLISAAGRTWYAFCPLSNITISMPNWSLYARKTPLQTGDLEVNSPTWFGPTPFGRSAFGFGATGARVTGKRLSRSRSCLSSWVRHLIFTLIPIISNCG